MIIFWNNLTVQRAADGQATAIEDVGVDHGGGDIFVAEKFLNRADIVTIFKQVGGKAVAKGVGANWLGQTHLLGSFADSFSQPAFIQMVSPDFAGTGIN